MRDPQSGQDETLNKAREVFEEWVGASAGKGSFEQLCADHEDLAAELERLHAGFCLAQTLTGSRSFQDALHEQFGDALEITVQLEEEATREEPRADPDGAKPPAVVIVNSRYTLQQELARGGMGVIWRVRDCDLSRTLAMKVMSLVGSGSAPPGGAAPTASDARGAADPTTRLGLARFLEEAQVTAQLDHPAVVPVHEVGCDPHGQPFFIMKLVKGRDLGEVFKLARAEQEGWNLSRAVAVLIKASQALAYAHTKGVIHRDLKPANIMVGRFGEVYVMDWGLARVIGKKDLHDIRPKATPLTSASLHSPRHEATESTPDSPLITMDGSVVGTPAYMPPEQAKGLVDEVDPASDVYSLGAILYNLLTGQPPYVELGARLSPHTILARVLDGPPKRVHELNREAPPELIAICEKAMAREKPGRYSSSAAFAEDLQSFLDRRVVRAYRTGAVAEFRSWVSRNKGLALAAVCVGLLTVVGTLGFIHQQARAKAQLRRNAYAAEMNVAHQALAENNLYRAMELLDRQKPGAGEEDLRGWEWRYLWQECQPSDIASYNESWGACVAFSPDGRLLAYHADPNVVVRDARTREVVTNLPCRAVTLSFSARAPLLAVAYETNVTLWNTETWRPSHTLFGATTMARFSSDGRWLATMGTNHFLLWDTMNWELKAACPGTVEHAWRARNVLCFSPDNRYLLTPFRSTYAGIDSFRLRELPGLEAVVGFEDSEEGTTAAAFSADGRYLLVGTHFGNLQIWDIGKRQLVRTEKAHTSWVPAVAVSLDGASLVTSGDATVVLWDAATRKLTARWRGHLCQPWALDISPNGKTVASTGDGTRLWSVEAANGHDRLAGSSMILGFLPDAHSAVAGTEDGIRIWDMASHSTSDIRIPGIEFRLDGFVRVAVNPRASLIALGNLDGTVAIWDLRSRQIRSSWQAHTSEITAIAFTPDGTNLATASPADDLRIWDTATHRLICQFRPPAEPVMCVAFSPDGRSMAASGSSATIGVYDWADRRERARLTQAGGWITDMAFSPDGDLLASARLQGSVVELWDMSSGKLQAQLSGLVASPRDVQFSPDGKTLAVAVDTKGVALWHVATQRELIQLPCDGFCRSLCFSPDGGLLAVGSCKGNAHQVRLYHAPSLREIDAEKGG